MELYCNTCNTKLTEGNLEQISLKGMQLKSERQVVEPGFYGLNDGSIMYFPYEITYIFNPADIQFRYHKDSSRLHGCCGPSPHDKLNITCSVCTNEIGVTSEDCIFPHFIGISKGAVSMKPLW